MYGKLNPVGVEHGDDVQRPPRQQGAQGVAGKPFGRVQAAADIGEKLQQHRASHPFHAVHAADKEDRLFAVADGYDGDRPPLHARADMGLA